MKIKKLIALAVAVLTITMAFVPNAKAEAYAPVSWGLWPVQGTETFSTRYAYAINRFLLLFYEGTNLTDEYEEYYEEMKNTSGKASGTFTYGTYKMVKKFQTEWNTTNSPHLTVDGAVGPYTWLAMRTYLSDAYSNEQCTLLAPSSYTGDRFYKMWRNISHTHVTVAFKLGSSQHWLVNRENGGSYYYIYS